MFIITRYIWYIIGGQEFLQAFPQAVQHIDKYSTHEASNCSKDLGEKTKLRMMSRGHQFVVRAGGHIDMWTPLYR